MKILLERDIDPPPLRGMKVAVIGYGSQGRAHAENLRDSGVSVTVGLRAGSGSRAAAEAAGFPVLSPREAAREAAVVALLVPDEIQGDLYREELAGSIDKGSALLFAHGFAVHFGLVSPAASADVVMVAPKGPGHQVREEYRRGRGVAALVAVHQDATGRARETALAYACAIGSGRCGIFESSFREECETDLFGEQAVICGGLSHLITAGFETLVEAGYPPELAYFECLHETKLVADLIYRRGVAGMREVISNTARFGDLTRGPRVISAAVKKEMANILEEIRSGRFAEEWVSASRSGKGSLDALSARGKCRPLEETGKRMRDLIFAGGEES